MLQRLPRNPYSLPELFATGARMLLPPPRRNDCPHNARLLLEPALAPTRWLGFVGDIMPLFGRTAHFASEVLAFFSDCDLIVGNFEGVLTTSRWFPFRHNHTPEIFSALTQLAPPNRWLFSLANNHACDFGAADLHRTVETMDSLGMWWVGLREKSRIVVAPRVTLTAWT